MHVVLGNTGAAAVRVRQSLVLDPALEIATAYAAARALAPDVPSDVLLAALRAAF